METRDQEHESLDSHGTLGSFDKRTGFQPFRYFALLGMAYGIVVGTTLSMNPTASVAVMYVAPVCAVVGIMAGVWYGFFFNISNRCTGGRIFCGIVAGIGAAAVGVLLLSLLWTIVGTAVGFAAGWLVGSLLTSPKRGYLAWIGGGVGAVVQSGWADPVTAVQNVIMWGVVGTIAGPLLLLLLFGLSYAVLRPVGPPRHLFSG